MNDTTTPPAGSRVWRKLLHPSVLLVIGSNALPLVGLIAWHWDAFVLLVLYWMEIVVVGFWTAARLAATARPTGVVALFWALHTLVSTTIGVGAYLAFLWVFFAGEWAQKIHGAREFYDQLVVETGLWVPLLVMFVSRGASFPVHVLKPDVIRALEPRIAGFEFLPPPADDRDAVVKDFMKRLILLHMAILFGGFVAKVSGSTAPLIVLVVVKTIEEVNLHQAYDVGEPAT